MSRTLCLLAITTALFAAVVNGNVHRGNARAPSAALRMPVVVASNMVLQRAPSQARIWGWTSASTGVTVKIGSQSKHTTSDSQGSWAVDLDPVSGGSTAYTMTVTDDNGGTSTMTNILFGDVYLCSGQSNMQMTVGMAFNSTDEIADSIHYPMLRVFTVAEKASLTPLYDVTSQASYQWGQSSPSVIGGPDWSYFSATCYFFGRELYKGLGGVLPIGLVDSDWGGTYIQAWSSPDALSKCNSTEAVREAVAAYGGVDMQIDMDTIPELITPVSNAKASLDAASFAVHSKAVKSSDPNPNTPSVLWNGMIVPLLPMRFNGAIWYQGEANVGDPTAYACQFPAMINDWRLKFNVALPFVFVQLAPFMDDNSFPPLRWAQTAALALSQVGMAVAMDLGDPQSPYSSIHPRDKQTVGSRVAANMLDIVYGQNVPRFGPSLSSWSNYEASGVVTFQVTFANANHLKYAGTEVCELCCLTSPWQWLNNQTQQWIPVAPQSVTLSGLTSTISVATGGADCGGLSYGWYEYPECVLYNENGLPGPEFFISTN